MNYVDAFVAAVPTAHRELYLEHAKLTAAVFKDRGASSVVECRGDDVPEGKITSFPLAVQRKADETVTFGWITWPLRSARDEGMKKAGEDPRLTNIERPFDGKRMILGGFEVMLTVN